MGVLSVLAGPNAQGAHTPAPGCPAPQWVSTVLHLSGWALSRTATALEACPCLLPRIRPGPLNLFENSVEISSVWT